VRAQVAQAGKRLSPSDPGAPGAGGPSLAWWDMMRLVWRGRVALSARRAEFSLGCAPAPDVGAASERLHVAADAVAVRLGYGDPGLGQGSRLAAAAAGVAATGFRAAGLDEPAGALLALPLAAFPAGLLLADPAWRLGSGRAPDAHHLYPAPAALPAGAVQARAGPGSSRPRAAGLLPGGCWAPGRLLTARCDAGRRPDRLPRRLCQRVAGHEVCSRGAIVGVR
jgi:hypothetical protein